MLSKEDHKNLLREADERVLPRRPDESDETYGKRMYQYLNGGCIADAPKVTE